MQHVCLSLLGLRIGSPRTGVIMMVSKCCWKVPQSALACTHLAWVWSSSPASTDDKDCFVSKPLCLKMESCCQVLQTMDGFEVWQNGRFHSSTLRELIHINSYRKMLHAGPKTHTSSHTAVARDGKPMNAQ